MTKKRLIYVSSSLDSVFESQVLQYLIELRKKNFFSEIYLLAGIKKKNDKKLVAFNGNIDLTIIPFKLYPNYHFFNKIQNYEFKKVLKNLLTEDTIVHVRGFSFSEGLYSIIKRSKFNNIKLITDSRGAVYEETLLYKKLKPIFFQLKLHQLRRNLSRLNRNTDAISCVSTSLKEYTLRRTPIAHDKIFVNHCLAGNNFSFSKSTRKEYRDKLGVKENEILFLFSTGGDGNWQNTTKIISNIADKGYKILNLSKQIINNKNIINLFVPYEEVPKYLNAVDLAVIWRKNDIVNNVASPVKFSEYICSGLPVIGNDGIDLVNKYVEETGFGVIIEDYEELNFELIEKLLKIDRQKISDNACKHFSSDTVIDGYHKIYEKLLENNKYKNTP